MTTPPLNIVAALITLSFAQLPGGVAGDVGMADVVKVFTSLGVAGVLAWLVWYLLAKHIPRMETNYENRLEKQALVFSKSMDALVEDQKQERQALRGERQAAVAAISENTKATERLATAVERMTGGS